MTSRLQRHYEQMSRADLLTKFSYQNAMQIPRIQKISLHMTLKQAVHDSQALQTAFLALELISGQRPTYTLAKKPISAFKLRKGMKIGCQVTLRHDRMYEFLDRLLTVVLPRLRDFHGIPQRGFDGRGNYSFGLRDFLVFPEIEAHYDLFDQVYGMDIHVVTSAGTDEECKALLSSLQVPFRTT